VPSITELADRFLKSEAHEALFKDLEREDHDSQRAYYVCWPLGLLLPLGVGPTADCVLCLGTTKLTEDRQVWGVAFPATVNSLSQVSSTCPQ